MPISFLKLTGPRRLARHPSCPGPGGFTFTELLSMLGLAFLLLGLMIPAFQSMARGSCRQAAIGSVIARLEAARATAIAEGRPVSLVLAAPQKPGEGHRATALYCQPEDRDLPPRRIGGWEPLPAGFVLEEDAALERLPTAPTAPGVRQHAALPCLVFGPTGALESARPSPRLVLKAPGGACEQIAIARFTGRCRREP